MRLPAALLLSLAACGDGAPPPVPIEEVAPPVSDLIPRVNDHRETAGCGALAWHGKIAAASQAHAEDMAANGYFSHESLDGRTFTDRLAEAGVTFSGAAGENIAMSSAGAEGVLAMWLGSSGHRANLENCAYTHHGLGYEAGLWVHMFAQNAAP
jgi:uncharacterized protein YkwD